jgi:hypothetical protein
MQNPVRTISLLRRPKSLKLSTSQRQQQAFAPAVVDTHRIRGKSGSAELAAQSLERRTSHEC